jgi:hypothetical protein
LRFLNLNSTDMNHIIKITIFGFILMFTLQSSNSCTKEPSPITVITHDVSNITQTSALAGGTVNADGDAEIISRGVCWGVALNPTISDNITTEGSGTGSFTSSLTGLTVGIEYHVRAYATSSDGTAYGSDISFTVGSSTGNILTIEGTTTVNNTSGKWSGVNIPRNTPTIFTFRNNSITSVNSEGYLLQAGDESPLPENNNLDGEVITGNKLIWKGQNSTSIITHGLFVGYNINSTVKYNYLENVPYGIIFKSGTDAGVNMTFTSGGCAYNISRNGKFAGRVKGINGVKFHNNTFYSGDGKGWYLILITENMDRDTPSPSTGTKIFNNIFYSTVQIPMIKIESGCLTDFESDYNLFWCTAGEPAFNIDGKTVSWAEWRGRGYDTHSRVVNPDFINTTDFVPRTRLDFGKDLGTEWQTGLSTTATWVVGLSPATTNQNGSWQVGARVY